MGTLLEQKMRERDSRKARLVSEIKRNRPELLRFNEKLGCRVSAGSEKTASGKSTIKFTFTLINPDDWSYEAKFVIDASKSQYKSESLQSGRQALSVTDTDLNGSPQPLPHNRPRQAGHNVGRAQLVSSPLHIHQAHACRLQGSH